MTRQELLDKVVNLSVQERVTLYPGNFADTDFGLDYWHMLAMLKAQGVEDIRLQEILFMRKQAFEKLDRIKIAQQAAKRLLA